jgi:Ca2+-binding RTX toxin-like protein
VLQFSAAANASNKIGNDPDVAVLADGKIVVTWEANEAFHAQVFLPDGTALGSVFDFTKPAGVVNVDHMELAAGNNLVVTYRSEDKKIWKAEYSVDALGAFTAVAPHSMVDSTTAAGTDLYEQQVLALQKSGGYAIVYRGSQLTLGDTGDILIKVYDATGAEVQQSRFKVNTSAAVQGEPALAELADGRIIVTWHDFNSDSFIQQQILDTRTAPVNVVGTDGADYYVGTSVGGDTLVGGLGDDKLEGGAGADTLKGGTDTPNAGAEGTDTASYLHAKAGVTVNMLTSVNAGDAAGDVFSSIENVEGSNFGDSLTGDNGANYLWGRGGNDVLSGGAAADTLDGGAGNDTYLITDSADKVVETAGNGIDTVIASFSFDLGTLPNVENLQAASGTASISLSGSIVDNALYGNDGINVLSGLDGNDSLFAYAGNDVVMGGNGNDVMSGGDGVDQVTGGAGNDVAYGEIGNDMLNGEAGNDVVYGGVGDDVLKGELGIDTLYGDVGKDKLYGGAGKDVLYGGKGQDGFYFDATLNKSTNVDRIMDFNSKEDTLYLARKFFKGMKAGKIASKAFYAGTAAHDADDRFIYNKKAGVIYFDSDGLGGKAQIQFALVKKGISVSAADFHVL